MEHLVSKLSVGKNKEEICMTISLDLHVTLLQRQDVREIIAHLRGGHLWAGAAHYHHKSIGERLLSHIYG
jgi:hypothetical protein